MLQRKKNQLYIGTHTGGLSIYDIVRNNFRNLYKENPDYARLAGDVVNQVALYKDTALVLLTQTGIFRFDLETEKLTYIFPNDNKFIGSCFLLDSRGYIWIARWGKLHKINMDNPYDSTVTSCGEKGLGKFNVTKILKIKRAGSSWVRRAADYSITTNPKISF
ncbi:MAG: hypothetical protein LUD02_07065 [Tannerellaceae bacterium]|nr:hypothetical protein [Tannerellaceae bacterium]MCD8263936.1 hypothetical protein [Tannerellaceae bacterium]